MKLVHIMTNQYTISCFIQNTAFISTFTVCMSHENKSKSTEYL